MSELLDALAARNQRVAAPYAVDYAEANRLFTVEIVRPTVEPTFNRQTGTFVEQLQPEVFTGSARIRPVNPGQQIDLGDGPSYWSDVQVSIGLEVVQPPQIDDLVTITAAPPPGVPGLVGKVYRVIGTAQGGHLAIGFDLTCTGVVPSRFTH